MFIYVWSKPSSETWSLVYKVAYVWKWPRSSNQYGWQLPQFKHILLPYMDRVKRIWYLSPMRSAKVQASLRIRAVSPEPPLLAHTSSESRGTFRQKARSLAPLNGWACAVKICHDGMLEDTNSLDGAHIYWQLVRLQVVTILDSENVAMFLRRHS